MQTFRTVLLAGAAVVLLCAAGDIAAAKSPESHVMTIRLPGGGVEEIRYTGNVPPRVIVSPAGTPVDFGWPVAFFGPDSAFAELNRISTEMNQQMDLMLRNARTLAAEPGLVTEINAGKLPPGSESYSFVSTMSGNGACAKSVEITSRGGGQKPQVVSKTWGDCGKGSDGDGVNSLAPSADQSSDIRAIRYNSQGSAPQNREAGAF
ncbi:MAG TPA: hypothetical protein VHT03_09310 [Rhizomicrobium sp.]|jgi:hypothetical protein|nr:hypothetical protein [Rhizomicrobium sp.]